MEELRSTDILDKEIRADSEKKAEKILAKAEETAKALVDEVQSRVEKSRNDAVDASKKHLAVYEKNALASIPLEKQRYLVSFINDSIVGAMNNYFGKLDSSKKEKIIENLARKAKSAVGERKVTAVTCGGLSVSEAEKILKNVFGSACCGVSQSDRNDCDLLSYGVIVVSEDNKVTCRLTLEETVNEILGQEREKLALSLFGGRLPE